MKFIDLFAGLGGFHLALSNLGHKCVFACEIDEDLRELYFKNFGIRPAGDIRKVKLEDIPSHDILCAGFPCQPFSKAGEQNGLACPRWGDLIQYTIKILQHHKPAFFILENVPNLLKHDEGKTWKAIKKQLEKDENYELEERILSPHKFGVPQIRERVYIVGSKKGLKGFAWPISKVRKEPSVETILDNHPRQARALSHQVINCLNVWQEFLDKFPKNQALPTFPIWSMEFGANYPYVKHTPYMSKKIRLTPRLRGDKATFQKIITSNSFRSLPSHARTKRSRFPDWKINFIRQNRKLYREHKAWIDKWLSRIRKFPPSLQKFEWNCNSSKRNIWKYIIQFRASGVRVKKGTTSPSLVAMTSTQVPIIAWEKRYMTPRECARLQSLIGLQYLPSQSTKAFKALGNAVNAKIVELVARKLFESTKDTEQHFVTKREKDRAMISLRKDLSITMSKKVFE